jgi:hypothetical protein
MDALTLDYKLSRLKKEVMQKCQDRINNGEKATDNGTLSTMSNLKGKWL